MLFSINLNVRSWSYKAGKDQKRKNKRDNETGRNLKSPGKEVEVVGACDAKRGAQLRNYSDGDGSTRQEEAKPKRRRLDRVRGAFK